MSLPAHTALRLALAAGLLSSCLSLLPDNAGASRLPGLELLPADDPAATGGGSGGNATDTGFERARQSIKAADLARHVAMLASDEFEGREPGTAGEEKTLRYLEKVFRDMGAKPGFGSSYLQPVPLIALRKTGVPRVAIQRGSVPVPLELTTDYIVQAGRPVPSVSLESLPIVFAGHGITSEPWDWDDYSGVSVEGAAVVLLRGEPISETDSTLFRGRALTSFGLSSSKYEAAARRGAKAAIVIHTDATAGYPWSTAAGGLGSTQNFLASGKDVPELDLVIYLNEPAARRLLEAAGLDFDQYLKGAATRGFAAKRSSLRLDASLAAEVSPVTSHNVVARIEGDEAPDEAVIYTAHWDHVGKNDALEGDRIFNGAVDNATGTSGILELAQAFLAAGRPPRRSVLFVATTAEEKGLLGSEYMARHPIVPLEKTVAVINLDALFPFGAFSAMTVTGLGSSEIEDILEEAAAREGRVLQDDGSPEVGAYYRSDHYPFAKRGVPALFAVGNPRNEELVEGSPIKQRFDDYLANGYHKPGDEYDPETWDLAGIEEDVRILFETGYRLAQDSRFPNWHFGNEFRHLRDQMLAP